MTRLSNPVRFGVLTLVLSLVLAPVNFVIGQETRTFEISPFFYWALYWDPYFPDSTEIVRIVSAENETIGGTSMHPSGSGYDRATIQGLLVALKTDYGTMPEQAVDRLSCLGHQLGLNPGEYLLISQTADQTNTAGIVDSIPFTVRLGEEC